MTVTDHPTRHRDVLGLSSAQVQAAAGITYRQLCFWVDAGHLPVDRLVAGTGSGNPRVWSIAERDYVVALARLVNAGIRVDIAARAMREAAPEIPTTILLAPGVTVHLAAS